MDRTPTLDLLVFLLTAMAGGLAVLIAVVAWRTRNARVARGAVLVALGIGVAYGAALVTVSVRSQTRHLAPGEVKHFCGFYLDCHLGASVDGSGRPVHIGTGADESVARGRFWIVTLRISNDARREPLTPYGITAVMVDADGHRYLRAFDAERVLSGDAGAVAGFDRRIEPGGSFTRRLVFDLPRSVRKPALLVTEQALPDSWIESVLIGDEDSWLHKPTLLEMPPAAERNGSP